MPTEETPRQILFALCWRGEEGALQKIKDLVERKEGGVNEVDENNVSALRFSAQFNHEEITTYLLEKGANTKIRAYDGRDALLSAVEKRNLEIAEILLKHGANPNAWSPETCLLLLARENRHTQMENLLIKYGAKEKKPLTQKCQIF
jgi:ankyrin repeat protein